MTNAESTARGTTTITFDVPRDSAGAITGGGNATFGIQLTGFPASSTAVIAAHIHPGAAGVNGSPLVDLNVSAARADRPDQRCRQREHHRRHLAGGRDEHHRGAGEFLFQRAHAAEWRWRGARAAGQAVGELSQRPTAKHQVPRHSQRPTSWSLFEGARFGSWRLGVPWNLFAWSCEASRIDEAAAPSEARSDPHPARGTSDRRTARAGCDAGRSRPPGCRSSTADRSASSIPPSTRRAWPRGCWR